MPKITDAEQLSELITTLLSYKDSKLLGKFLQAILTPQELKEIPTRLQIIKLLKQGISQREVAQQLGVGIATVTRGSKELQKGSFSDIE